MARFKRPNFGTVSTGTLKPEDLRESFLYELRQQRPLHDTSRALIRDLEACPQSDDTNEWDVLQLMRELNLYAPVGYVFGAYATDQADFGYWPISAPSAQETPEAERLRVFGACGGKCGEAPCIAWNLEHQRRQKRVSARLTIPQHPEGWDA